MTTELRDQVAALLASFDVHSLEPFLAACERTYARDVTFRDPMQERNGLDEFLAMNRSLAKKARSIQFQILDKAGDDDLFYLRWRMVMRPLFGPEIEVEGVSHLRAREGKVTEHIDYWDLGDMVASMIPMGKAMKRAVLRPLA